MKNDKNNSSSVPGRTNDPETFAKFASVKNFQDFLKDKENSVVMITLSLNGKGFLDTATFSLQLSQHTNAHDEFTIVVNDTASDEKLQRSFRREHYYSFPSSWKYCAVIQRDYSQYP